MPSPVSITVVVPSYGRLAQVVDVAGRYLGQGADQVVVVLDGPHPGWEQAFGALRAGSGGEWAGALDVVALPANRGRAIARSIGLAHATGDAVLLADDDVVPLPGLVDRHRTFHTEERRAAGAHHGAADAHHGAALLGTMPVRLPAHRGRDDAPTHVYARDYANQVAAWRTADAHGLLTSFWTGNASVGRALLERAEALRPVAALGYNEDLDLGLRLAALGARAAFDELAAAEHLHRRGLRAFLAECVVRGEAVADLEDRWPDDALPGQIRDLVRIPAGHARLAARLQRGIGARDTPGATEACLVAAYRITGRLRMWRAQDAITRFLRRGLAIRGHRIRRRTRGAGDGHATPPHPGGA